VHRGRAQGQDAPRITNQLQYLRHCDGVIVLDRDEGGSGYIKLQGSYADLMRYAEFAQTLRLRATAAAPGEEESEEATTEGCCV